MFPKPSNFQAFPCWTPRAHWRMPNIMFLDTPVPRPFVRRKSQPIQFDGRQGFSVLLVDLTICCTLFSPAGIIPSSWPAEINVSFSIIGAEDAICSRVARYICLVVSSRLVLVEPQQLPLESCIADFGTSLAPQHSLSVPSLSRGERGRTLYPSIRAAPARVREWQSTLR